MSSRRRFLAQASATASALGFPAIVSSQSPNQKVNLAFIGSGGRGAANLKELTKNPAMSQVVALCDVNEQNLYRAAEQFPQAAKFKDFRRLFEEQKDIDAVVVSTTEHTHAYAILPALRMKKPVYCEKPLTHNVSEAALIIEATKNASVPTQMGTQMHASANYRRVVELIQTSAIGKVTECHVWVSRAWGLQTKAEAEQNKEIVFVTERPKETMKAPDYLDWDLWLGPAPSRPYHDVYFPGPKWYRWWDFGNGTMSDLGSHWNDLPWWALKLDAPLSVEANSPHGPAHDEIAPASLTARYEYGPRGDLPACTLVWHQGSSKPGLWHEHAELQAWKNGVLFIGDKGMLVADYTKHKLLPEQNFKEFQPPAPFLPDSPGQHQQWLDAIRNGTPTDSPFDTYSGPLTIANHLGNVAYRAGKKLLWDAATRKATNAPEAATFLGREPRAGWSLA